MLKFTHKVTATALVALSLAGSMGCKAKGPEGTYTIDKDAMKKSMEAEIAKMPAEQQAFAKLALTMIDSLDMNLVIEPEGKLTLKTTQPSLTDKPAKTVDKTGTWKIEGKNLVMETDGKPLSCTQEESKLTCVSGAKEGEPALVFLKKP